MQISFLLHDGYFVYIFLCLAIQLLSCIFICFFLPYYHLFGVLCFTCRLFSGGNDSSSIGI